MARLLRTAVIALALLASPLIHAAEVVIPSDLSVHLSAQPAVNIEPGEPIVFTLTITNHGPEPVNHVGFISSDFYDQIDLNFGGADCKGIVLSVADGETFHFNYSWYPTLFDGPLAVGESRTCHITLALTHQAPPIWSLGFSLRTFFEDINPSNNAATVILRRGEAAPTTVPSHSPLTLLLLVMGLLATAWWMLSQRVRGHAGAL